MKRKTKTKIHVNQHIIKSNRKKDLEEPVFTVKQGSGRPTRYAKGVIIDGPSQLVYRPNKPLSCGAHVWIETIADVYLTGEKKFEDLKR